MHDPSGKHDMRDLKGFNLKPSDTAYTGTGSPRESQILKGTKEAQNFNPGQVKAMSSNLNNSQVGASAGLGNTNGNEYKT
jgi:hypothetical protein